MILFSLKNISKSQLNIILLIRPLGATRCCSKFTRLYLQSPCSLLHNDPPLGGYTGWSFYERQEITSPRLLQAWQPGTWGLHIWSIQFIWLRWTNRISSRMKHLLEQVLSYHYVLLLRLGGYRYYAYKGGHLHFISFEQIRKINYMTRCRQLLWPGAINIYKPAILVILNRQVLHLQTGWISDKYFKTHIS